MCSSNNIVIPIIPYGLQQEETIIQIAVSLSNIDTIVSDVFRTIEENIEKHKSYLATLQKRSRTLAAKVDKLAGRKIATTVFSHPKFPSEENNFNTLFSCNLQNSDKLNVPINSKIQHNKYNKISHKLHFYHVKSNIRDFHNEGLTIKQGIGPIPPNLEYTSSLILFNTAENLFKNYVMRDPLAVRKIYLESSTEDEKPNNLAAAPLSMVNNFGHANNEYFSCFYKPPYEEVPNINVPLNLPDLPGIADDLKFNITVDHSIAPSKQSNVIKHEEEKEEIFQDNITISQTIVNTEYSSIKSQLQTLNHPPPLPPVFPTLLNTSETLDLPSPPPPPPLPPPYPSDFSVLKNSTNQNLAGTVNNINDESSTISKPINSFDNMHANLMEAIRNAGGKEKAKLRPIHTTQIMEIDTKSSTEESFMADLYAKLALRRKGISGVAKDSKNSTMVEHMSAMIPPSPSSSSESDDHTIHDWDE